MKRIVRLTESDLKRIVRKTIREMSGDNMGDEYSYNISTIDCTKYGEFSDIVPVSVDIDEDDTIVIKYCEGDIEALEYGKEKGRRLLKSRSIPKEPIKFPNKDYQWGSDDDFGSDGWNQNYGPDRY